MHVRLEVYIPDKKSPFECRFARLDQSELLPLLFKSEDVEVLFPPPLPTYQVFNLRDAFEKKWRTIRLALMFKPVKHFNLFSDIGR